jgi:HSP20 family protein
MFDMVPFRSNNNSMAKRGDYFNQLFNNFFDDDFFAPVNYISNGFRVDLKETDDEYMIEADLPGMNKDAIDISYENNYITIAAKRDDSVEDKRHNYVRRERRCGEFSRSFYIDNVDENNIDAEFKDGVLKVSLPKKDKTKINRKKINIK